MVNHNKGNNTHHKKGKEVEDSNNQKRETDKCGSRNEKKNKKKKYEKNRNVEANKYNGFRKKEEGFSILKNGDSPSSCNSNNCDNGNNMGNTGISKMEYNHRSVGKESKSFYEETTKTYKTGNIKAEEKKKDQKKEIHVNEEWKNKNCRNGEYPLEAKTVEINNTVIKGYEPQVSNNDVIKEQDENEEEEKGIRKNIGKDMGKNKEKEKTQRHKLRMKKSKNLVNFNCTIVHTEQTDIHTDTSAEVDLKSSRNSENTKKGHENSYASLLQEKENEINVYLTEACVDVGRNHILKMDDYDEKGNKVSKNDNSILSNFSSSYVYQKRKGGIQEENEERDSKHRKNVKNVTNEKQDEKKVLERIQRNVKKEKNVIKKANEHNNSREKNEGTHVYESNISNTNSNSVPGINTTTLYANKETCRYVENVHDERVLMKNCSSYSTNQYSTDNDNKGVDTILIGKYTSADVNKDNKNNTVAQVQQKVDPLLNQKSSTKGKKQTFTFEKTAKMEKYGSGTSKENKVPDDLKYNDAEGNKIENRNNKIIKQAKTKPSLEELLLEKKKMLEQEEREKKKQKSYTAEIIRCELIWGPTKNKEPITPVENCELHPVVIIKDQYGHLYDDDEDNENNPIGKTANIYYRWSRGPPRTVCFFHPQKISCLQCTATSRCFCSYECFIKGFVQLHKYYKSNDAYVLPSHPNIHTYGVPCSPFDWENYENNMEFDEQHYNSLIQAGLLSNPDEEIWETVHNERNYVPCASDIGHQLKLETLLLDKDGEFAEEMVETYVSSEEESEKVTEAEVEEEKLETTEEAEKKQTQQKIDRVIEGETQNGNINNGTEKKEVSHGERRIGKEGGGNEEKQKNGASRGITKSNMGDNNDDDGISDKGNLIRSVGYGDVYKLFQNASNTAGYPNQFAYNTVPNVINCVPVYNGSNVQVSANPYVKNEHIISDGTSATGSLVGTWKDMNCNMGVDYMTECGVNYNIYETNYNRTYNMNFGNTDGGNFISNALTTNWNKASFPNSNEKLYQENEMGAYPLITQPYEHRGINEMEKNNTGEDGPVDVDVAMNNNNYISSSYMNRDDNGDMYANMNSMDSNNFPYINNTEQENKREVYYNIYDKRVSTTLCNTSFSNGEMQYLNTTFLENKKKQHEKNVQEKYTTELASKQQSHPKQKKKKKKCTF